MGDLYDEHNKIVTVVLLLSPTSKKGNVLDLIKVSSAEGRSYIQSLFKKEDGSPVAIRYMDEKRIRNWLNVNRLQLPLHSSNTDSNDIILNDEDSVKNNISNETIFSVKSEQIPEGVKKTQYVLDVFDEQGNIAKNDKIGIVELVQSGAKSTVFHGFGAEKLVATKAIKSVIEQGNIIKITKNYNNTGVDRYVMAAKGYIDSKPAYVGLIIKAYPTQKNQNAKFYLHEAAIIKTDSPIMTAPQLSVDTVSESVSDNSILKKESTVKNNISNETENYSDEPFSIGSPMQREAQGMVILCYYYLN